MARLSKAQRGHAAKLAARRARDRARREDEREAQRRHAEALDRRRERDRARREEAAREEVGRARRHEEALKRRRERDRARREEAARLATEAKARRSAAAKKARARKIARERAALEPLLSRLVELQQIAAPSAEVKRAHAKWYKRKQQTKLLGWKAYAAIVEDIAESLDIDDADAYVES